MSTSRKIYITSIITYLVAIIIFAFDQLTKQAIIGELGLQQSRIIFPWLWLTHVVNHGAAFSTFYGQRVLLSIFASLISLGIIFYERMSYHNRTKLLSFSMGFLLAGAAGNLFDRLRMGYVTDFLDLRNNGQNIWPIFNVADISINIGIGLLILYYIFQDKKVVDDPNDLVDDEIPERPTARDYEEEEFAGGHEDEVPAEISGEIDGNEPEPDKKDENPTEKLI